MAESVYKVIELVGTSTDSWEKAASAAVERAAETLRDLRVAEVVEQDIAIKDGKVEAYRVKEAVLQVREGRRLIRPAMRGATVRAPSRSAGPSHFPLPRPHPEEQPKAASRRSGEG